jgi:predicted GTPase
MTASNHGKHQKMKINIKIVNYIKYTKDSNKIRVLVLGETGVGKSSLVDALITRAEHQEIWVDIEKSMLLHY